MRYVCNSVPEDDRSAGLGSLLISLLCRSEGGESPLLPGLLQRELRGRPLGLQPGMTASWGPFPTAMLSRSQSLWLDASAVLLWMTYAAFLEKCEAFINIHKAGFL